METKIVIIKEVMDRMNKFYEIKNSTSINADLYIYGEIVTEKWYENDVSLNDFKESLENLGEIQELNMYINSPGGSVFVASTMISMLKRLKDKGITINAYVDGIAASAASFVLMVADNIYLYKNSIVMIHKPMTFAYGNAIELQKEIDALNKIEDSVMIPMYMDKAKISEDEIRSKINDETWLDSNDMDEMFKINLVDEEKHVAAKIDMELLKNYKNIPKDIIKEENDKFDKEREEIISKKIKLIKSSLFCMKEEGEKNYE